MVERLFLEVPWGCLRFVIVVFPDHTHLLFLATVRWKVVDDLLFVDAPIILIGFLFCSCFDLQYEVLFLVLQLSLCFI